jgi:hypothetical protein
VNADNNTVTVGTAAARIPLAVNGNMRLDGSATIEGAAKVNAVTDSTSKDTGALMVEGGVGIEKALFVGGAVTAGRVVATGDADITGVLYANGGVLTSARWDFTDTTQNDWFQKFVNIIPIGKILQVKGFLWYRADPARDPIRCSANEITRINDNTIEIRCIGFNTTIYIQNITCINGNNSAVTSGGNFYVSW